MPADGLTTGRANGVFAVRGLSPRSPESNCKLLRTPTVTQSHGNPTVTRRAGVRSGLLCSPPSELLGPPPPRQTCLGYCGQECVPVCVSVA